MNNTENKSKTKVHTNLYNIIGSQPGITRQQILDNRFLQEVCMTKAQRALLEQGDETTLKRWNRKINRYLRQIRRDGHDIIVSRHNGHAFYYVDEENAADVRWNSLTQSPEEEVLETATQVPFPKVDPQRELEEEDQLVSFEQLMADLDSDVLGQTDEMKANNLLF